MKTLFSQSKQYKILALQALFFAGLIGIGHTAFCLTTEPPVQSPLFKYSIKKRNDPFVPFISEKAASTKMDEIISVDQQLTGMQIFEPGQLELVAIITIENDDFAMAEDTTGEGYILRKDMKIGKRGVITDIRSNEVIIEETAFTRAGKKITTNIVMLLKKEGEQ